jgi:hypothetical protein
MGANAKGLPCSRQAAESVVGEIRSVSIEGKNEIGERITLVVILRSVIGKKEAQTI